DFLGNKLTKRFIFAFTNRKSLADRFAVPVVPEIGYIGGKFTSYGIGFDFIIQIKRMIPGLRILVLNALVGQNTVVRIVHTDLRTKAFIVTKIIIKPDVLFRINFIIQIHTSTHICIWVNYSSLRFA